jgi:HEPN domain-containing protein
MNTKAMAQAYLKDAEYSLKEARLGLEEKVYHRAVRRAQESTELALKAVLRLIGIEYPREHSVGESLLRARRKLPAWFVSSLPEIVEIEKGLTEQRGPAFYGDERAFIPPENLYNKKDARKAISDASKVLRLCKRLFREWKG